MFANNSTGMASASAGGDYETGTLLVLRPSVFQYMADMIKGAEDLRRDPTVGLALELQGQLRNLERSASSSSDGNEAGVAERISAYVNGFVRKLSNQFSPSLSRQFPTTIVAHKTGSEAEIRRGGGGAGVEEYGGGRPVAPAAAAVPVLPQPLVAHGLPPHHQHHHARPPLLLEHLQHHNAAQGGIPHPLPEEWEELAQSLYGSSKQRNREIANLLRQLSRSPILYHELDGSYLGLPGK